MGSGNVRRRVARSTRIETLEERQMFSVDLLGGLLGGSIQQHSVTEEPPLVLHSAPPLELHNLDVPLAHHDVDLSLIHHTERNADFWIDYATERDVDQLLGDVEQTLSSAHDLTGWKQVRTDYGFTGIGQTVAVIDSGIAYDHWALGGGMGSSYRVVGGWDFTEENDANFYDDGSAGGHGTHVSGIVGGDRTGTNDDGVAPGVDLVGLRVFNDAGDGYFNWVENALNWVHANRNSFENPITAVNLSLGTAWNSATIPNWAMLEEEFAQLEADGIFISVSAGNSFQSYNAPGLSYPAASSHVVPVMSVDDSGDLSYFSQRHSRAIAAPGRFITSTVPDYVGNHNGVTDDFASWSGTSMAAPYVAGASVLVREAMQFVGQTNIDQWDIYDHMMATADTFFDAATNANYKRLNLASAIDALIPTDDYGSSIVDAYNLGSVSGSGQLSGLIGKLDDADFFRFTAGVTGSVTFTADTTHQLVAAWSGSGAANGNTYTIQVQAGQTYTVGLSTSSGLGYYDLDFVAESSFSFTDWGTISQWQTNDLANSGEAWYRVQASQGGYLTAEAFFSGAAGNIDLAWFDSNMQQVAVGVGSANSERVDRLVSAGEQLYLRVTGTNADVDFRCTNLVSLEGSTVGVAGTAGADTFTFTAGGASHTVSVNGVSYQFAVGSVSTINFSGAAGSDSITMTGTSGDETATLQVGTAQLTGSGYTANASSVETVTLHSGGGNDSVNLYDSAGNDTFTTWSDRAVMYGTGYWNDARGFSTVCAYASTGNDRAVLRDTAGDDTFTSWWNRGIMYGNGYWNEARGFDRVEAYASTGNDRAVLRDTNGDDTFTTWWDRAIMYSGGYWNEARGFDRVEAYATNGNDTAMLRDSAGDDMFSSWWDRSIMYGNGYWNDARGFDRVYAFASSGNDQAMLRDSAGDDTLSTWWDRAIMYGDGYWNDARGFDLVYGFASTGNDRAVLRDSAGDDVYEAWFDRSLMRGSGFWNEARGFDRVEAYASTGYDRALFYDTIGDDVYTSWWDRAVMYGNGYWNDARGFDRTNAYSTGGNDRAVLRDSSAHDEVHASGSNAYITGANYRNEVDGFGRVDVYDLDGDGSDEASVGAVDFLFNLYGNWTSA